MYLPLAAVSLSPLLSAGLPGRSLLLRFFVGAMVPDCASRRSTKNSMMTGEVPGGGANRSALGAPLCLG